MIVKFWWGLKDGDRKIHWLSWDKSAQEKFVGGMGFRGISDFNISLLQKHYWRLLSNENSLLGKVLKGRYFPRNSFADASVGFSLGYA